MYLFRWARPNKLSFDNIDSDVSPSVLNLNINGHDYAIGELLVRKNDFRFTSSSPLTILTTELIGDISLTLSREESVVGSIFVVSAST